jgi:aminoglycoside/choline kinase family phosphotransferase
LYAKGVLSYFGTSFFISPFCISTPLEQDLIQNLSTLFTTWCGETVSNIETIPLSGSERRYFRLVGSTQRAIGAYHTNKAENRAFLTFTKHFVSKGLPVPQLYAEHPDGEMYLVQDLGNQSLFDYLIKDCKGQPFPEEAYQKSLAALVRFQLDGGDGLDYSVCYPRADFDRQSMMWDLSYFKYYFARVARFKYDEQTLEDDFNTLANYLNQANTGHFMFRDFQARNVMLVNGEPYGIDYQGGRRGPLQYDLVSLLWQAKANISPDTRERLLHFYLDELEKRLQIDRHSFVSYYYGFVLIRTLQVLGAYGYRGYIERKAHFLASIPFAIDNLEWLIQNTTLPISIPALNDLVQQIIHAKHLRQSAHIKDENKSLTVRVTSFSYKRGIPEDPSGNGGGFVFDCRAIHNPGKYEPYKHLTGRDAEVIQFLQTESDVEEFLVSVFALVEMQVEKYLSRSFSNLMVNFGCTGGQHRSVYCADRLAKHLKEKYGVTMILTHVEQENKGWKN